MEPGMDRVEDSDDDTKPPLDSGIPDKLLDLFDPAGQAPVALETWPEPGEKLAALVRRAAQSDIPEEGVTMIAFALGAVDAIAWACDCCEAVPGAFREADEEIIAEVQAWLDTPDDLARGRLLRLCLWQPERTPGVLLGLAAGFNGGHLAPQWPAPVPPEMVPVCVNEALMGALACVEPAQRDACVSRFLAFAEPYL
jgi:hypothetical protein